jgi:hypothetical protein
MSIDLARRRNRLAPLFFILACLLGWCPRTHAAASSAGTGLAAIELNSFLDYQPTKTSPQAVSIPLPLKSAEISNATVVQAALRWSDNAQQALWRNGFVVVPWRKEVDMIAAYREMPQSGIPNFVTSDSLLHLYHVQFDEILKDIESGEFHPYLVTLTTTLLTQAQAQYLATTGDLQEAVRRNVVYLAVARTLMGDATPPPAYAAADVAAELALINAHAGFASSPLFKYQEDYSQYVPRGHYTRSVPLQQYFKTMMWYGRMAFLLKGSVPWGPDQAALVSVDDARIQTLQAVLLALGLDSLQSGGQAIADRWNRIYAVTAFFVGLADDLTPFEYRQAVAKVLGAVANLSDLTNSDQFQALKIELAAQPSPQIFGGTGNALIPPNATAADLDRLLDKTKGMRLMGQRFIPDAYLFQNQVNPVVGRYTGTNQPFTLVATPAGLVRGFPRGLDLMAVLGSEAALAILDREGDTDYENYDLAVNQLLRQFRSFTPADWTRNLYWGWLFTLQPLLDRCGPGYPAFMQTSAWQEKQLQTALASWTELRHDTILYAKQSYTAGTTSIGPSEPPAGYVEPCPEFFNRLGALTRLTRLGLSALNVLDTTQVTRLTTLEQILSRLTAMATTELEGRSLSTDDNRYLQSFASTLAPLVAGLADAQAPQTVLVADVHTDGHTGKVLEEGVGYVNLLAVAFPKPGGGTVLGVGPVFSYYEFKWPMSDRLTDEKWTNLLYNAQNPDGPNWTHRFLVPVSMSETNASDAAFNLLAPAETPSGLVTLKWSAAAARRYRVFYSDDLRDWYLLQTPVVAASGWAGILDPLNSQVRQRFYRVQCVP